MNVRFDSLNGWGWHLRALTLNLIIVVCLGFFIPTTFALEASSESDNGRMAHESLIQELTQQEHVIGKDVNSGEEILYRVTLAKAQAFPKPDANGAVRLPIPDWAKKNWQRFDGFIVFPKKGADGQPVKKCSIRLRLLRGDKQSAPVGAKPGLHNLPGSFLYYRDLFAIPIASEQALELEISPAADLDQIGLFGAIPLEYAEDHVKRDKNAPVPVKLTLDATRQRFINGVSQLDRAVYFQTHDRPEWGPVSQKVREEFKAEQVRDMWHFGPELIKDGLREDPTRPGWADLSFFEQKPIGVAGNYKSLRDRNPQLKTILSLDQYPDFMTVKGLPSNETPANYEAAAALLSALYNNIYKFAGMAPAYIEPFNECDIQDRWGYHWNPGAWDKLSDFFNTVIKKMHEDHPEILVGGPTSAWPHWGGKWPDYSVKGHKTFIEKTGHHIDFYGIHNYDNACLSGYQGWRANKANVTHGKGEAVLDFIRVYAHKKHPSRNVPILISEMGTVGDKKEYDEFKRWQRLRPMIPLTMMYLDRQDHMLMAVPFILTHAVWDNEYVHLYKMEGGEPHPTMPRGRIGGKYVETEMALFYRFWLDVAGVRLPFRSADRFVDTAAFLDESRIYLVVHNKSGAPRILDFGCSLPEGAQIKDIKRKRLYFDGQKVVYEPGENIEKVDGAVLEDDESSLFTIELNQAPRLASGVDEITCYAEAIEQPIEPGKKITFTIPVPVTGNPVVGGRLRLGLAAEGGFGENPRATWNGQEIKLETEFSKGIKSFFMPVECDLPADQIKTGNSLAIEFPSSKGMAVYVILYCHKQKTLAN